MENIQSFEQIKLLLHTKTVDRKVIQERLKKAYYEDKPIITDAQYDELFGDDDYVGYTPSTDGPWQVLEHKIAMGSLNKLKTWEQAEKWLKDKGPVVWEPKLDGLSIELVYEKGTLTHAVLRGGGDKGEDILKNAKNFAGVKHTLENANSYVSVRGEVIISKTNFELLNKESEEAYSNRRNCISGICRRYDGKYSGLLGFYAYDIIEFLENENEKLYISESEKLTTLYNYGFRLPFAYNTMTEQQYNDYGNIRDTAEEFQMDGLVIKTLDMTEQIALKFEPKGELTKITHYTWEVGSTGKLVPTIWFKPVTVGGTRLVKAAVGSFQGYLDLDATIDSVVEVRKMGDVIPKVTKVVTKANSLLEIPVTCPKCKVPLQRQGTDLYCKNHNCPAKQESKCCSVYWAMCLKGITDSWVKALMTNGKVSHCYDIPKVKAEDIANIDGYSMNKAEKMIAHFKERYAKIIQENDIATFMWMCPIPTVKGKSMESLIGLFSTIEELKSWLLSDFDNDKLQQLINTLGNSKGNKAYEYFKEDSSDLLELLYTMEDAIND